MTYNITLRDTPPPAASTRYTPDQIDLIKATVAKGATDDELRLFLNVAGRTGLDPFTRQIHFIKRRQKDRATGSWISVGTIQTGIDGYRAIAERSGELAGNDDAIFEDGADGKPVKATVTVYRMVQGQRCPFTASARFAEYAPSEGGGLWGRMPHHMLAKVAEALALRKAFPSDLSGLYTREEMAQAATPDQDAPSPSVAPDPALARLASTAETIDPETGEVTVVEPPRDGRDAFGLPPSPPLDRAYFEATFRSYWDAKDRGALNAWYRATTDDGRAIIRDLIEAEKAKGTEGGEAADR